MSQAYVYPLLTPNVSLKLSGAGIGAHWDRAARSIIAARTSTGHLGGQLCKTVRRRKQLSPHSVD